MNSRQSPGPPQIPAIDPYRPATEPAATGRPAGALPPVSGQPHSRSGRGHKHGRRKKGSAISAILFGGLLVLVAVGAAGAVILSTLSPAEMVQAEAIKRVKAATGRDLVIAGPASFRLFPSIGFSLSDVSLSAPSGTNAKPLITMSSLDLSVRLLSLLGRKVVVDRLILNNPVIELHVDTGGRKSWDFAEALPVSPIRKPVRLAQANTNSLSDAAPPSAEASNDNLAAEGINLQNLELGNVRIEDGTLHYSDARSGAKEEATGINVKVSLRSISRPLETAGSLIWKGEKIDIDATLTSIKMLMENHPARIAMTIASRPVNASYDGSFSVRETVDAEGRISADAPSLRGLANWLGTGLPEVDGFGPFEMKGLFRLAGKVASLTAADIALDGAKITGQASVDTAQARPYVKGNLNFSELDLNKYAGPAGAAKNRPAAKRKPAASAAEKSIDDLLSDPAATTPGPKVKGYTQRAGWSEGPIDASALGFVDADTQITVERLLFKELKIGRSLITVALKNKVLRANFEDIALYSGHGRGLVTLDATAANAVAIATNLTLEGIAAAPLLKDAAGMDWLAGTAKIALVVTGQGQNQRQIVETLSGKTDLLVTNGAIVGWNLPGMVRSLSQGKLSGLNRTPSEKTDFSEMASIWVITNGIAQNQDLQLQSPLLRVTGSGSVMLPPRQVDYTVRPVLVASLEGQGAQTKSQGLEIPVRIHGSWEKPAYTPDIGGVLKDPNQAVQTLKELGKQFKGKSADEIVKGLLGKKSDSNAAPSAGTATKDEGKQLLDQLFKP